MALGLSSPATVQQNSLNRQAFFMDMVQQGSAERLRQKAIEQAKKEQEEARRKADEGGLWGGILGALGGGIAGFFTGGGIPGAFIGAAQGGLSGFSSGRETGDPAQGALIGAATGGLGGIQEKQRKDALLAAAVGKFSVLSDEQKNNLGLDASKTFQVSPEGKITEIGKSGVTVNLDNGPQFGTIPAGQMLVENEGSFRLEDIPGGPQSKKDDLLKVKQGEQKNLLQRAGNVVIKDIARLRDKITEAPFYRPIAGVISSIILPELNQGRIDSEALSKTIQANIGFDRLQQMREASPTGGALGQVSDRELSTLQSVLGNLELNQSEKQLVSNIDRLSDIYSTILEKANAYPNASDYGFGGGSNTETDIDSSILDTSIMDIFNNIKGRR